MIVLIKRTLAKIRQHIRRYKGLIYNAGLMFSLRFIQKTTNFITVILLARTLTEVQYGYYSYIYIFIGIFSIFTLPGLKEGIKQSSSRGFGGTFLKCNVLSFKSSFIGSALLLIVAGYYFYQNNFLLAQCFLVTSLFFSISEGIGQWRPYFAGTEKFKYLFVTNVLSAIIRLALMAGLVLFLSFSLLEVILINVVVYGIENVVMSLLARRAASSSPKLEPDIVEYGFKINSYKALDMFAKQFDKLLLFHFLSPTALAIYVISQQFSEIIRKPVFDIALVLTPHLARTKMYNKSIDSKLIKLGIVTSIITLLFVIITPYGLPMLYGEKYFDSITIAQCIIATYVIGNITFFQSQYFKSQMDANSVRRLILTSAFTRIVGNIVLIPFIGIYGAIISLLCERVIRAVLIRYIVHKKYLNHNKKALQP